MKLSWLLPVVLGGGGAAANPDRAGSDVSDKVSGYETKVILGKGIAYQQDKRAEQHDGASIQSASANEVRVELDTLNAALPNQTKPKINIQRDALNSDPFKDSIPSITVRASNNVPPEPDHPPARQAEPPSPDYDPGADQGSGSASKAAETGNPASANRAIAGMSAGLVSVMLIFTVFL